ncbi:hypothetical protein BJ138DRAFT_1016924 [Hygrophoropsis aurantiaca]|uniref:Uncharacterized protein n=1 Tax=Hygrophoropsis aurantiaca TaxID=72124 RepID=A0ACB7ZZA3_9AGAM|nr:hypothetical protein BJ138DRAFT_1016924 [Hygrophoropsis aurantiaca]
MRQNVQSDADAKLRTALENMRYKACTEEDIAFLTSRIVSNDPKGPSLKDSKFRDVSIITAWNSQKDQINELGAQRFADDHGVELVSFYSEDKWADGNKNLNNGRLKKSKLSAHHQGSLSLEDQQVLWSLLPHTSDHFAAQLKLCVGMPVIIRNNDATELCITKGQEGIVAGWQFSMGSKGQQVLETLFVKLVNPPNDVQIEGLPPNVVPIAKTTRTVSVCLQDDSIVQVVREQVNILLNFGMTDYTAQGKTRPYNVVDLQHCNNHQSYYTCLSRSASAEGTAIMQSFDRRKITGGASGWLRQEYRALELLDEITLLRYNNELPGFVDGHRRNTLIDLYQQWKGNLHVPSRVSHHIKWTTNDPFHPDNNVDHLEWKIFDRKGFYEEKRKEEHSKFVPAKGSKPIETGSLSKRKADTDLKDNYTIKKTKIEQENPSSSGAMTGFKWDSVDYSCAYDSLFTILLNIWSSNPHRWNKHLKNFTVYFDLLLKGFQRSFQNVASLEEGRDAVRSRLNSYNVAKFPMGPTGTSVSELAHTMIGSDQDPVSWIRCVPCGAKVPTGRRFAHIYCPVVDHSISTAEWVAAKWANSEVHPCQCTQCDSFVSGQWQSDTPPKILIFDVANQEVSISHMIYLRGNKLNTKLHLKGIVYYKANHFTSIVVTAEGHIKFHDGMLSANLQDKGNPLRAVPPSDLSHWDGAQACLAVYARSF